MAVEALARAAEEGNALAYDTITARIKVRFSTMVLVGTVLNLRKEMCSGSETGSY